MKKNGIKLILIILTFILPVRQALPQDTLRTGNKTSLADSLAAIGYITSTPHDKPVIRFDKDEALSYLQSKYVSDNWTNPADPLRISLGQLIFFASNPPYESLNHFLETYSYDSLNLSWNRFYIWDTLRMKVPVVKYQGPVSLSDSVIRQDATGIAVEADSLHSGENTGLSDSTLHYRPGVNEPAMMLKDTLFIIAPDSTIEVVPFGKDNPFRLYRYPFQGDSISSAVKTLTSYLKERDSTVVKFGGVGGSVIPVWLNSKSGKMTRYWLKNDYSDSVTVWIGSTDWNSIGMYLEEGIMFRRPSKQTNISDAQLNLKKVNTANLQDVNKVYIKPIAWRVRSEANFVLNQAFMSNWVKGGENSLSTAMDISGFADYNNKQLKVISNNFIRLKYGLIMSEGTGVRKNLDLLETNSKINHKAFGKFDFSGILLFKTQISKGYSYVVPKGSDHDTAILVSRFMNPAILTAGLGLDYKPNKTTSINFAPFSYKGTFVPDTSKIDQTKYGISADRRSLNEPGASLQFTNEFNPFKTVTVTNRLQLFTNYINNPQNIDVDWEMILTLKLNWFTEVRLNTHMIYDDDIKTVKLDKEGSPVVGTDGIPVKNARLQFKELLGFSFVFRF
jgi:hypothetical protein